MADKNRSTENHSTETVTNVIQEDYEPGNATRYDLVWVDSAELFAWVNAPGGGCCCHLAPGGGAVSIGYLAEKLGLRVDRREADLAVILVWLRTRVGFHVMQPPGYDENGRWIREVPRD
jgi:hypothetical protein